MYREPRVVSKMEWRILDRKKINDVEDEVFSMASSSVTKRMDSHDQRNVSKNKISEVTPPSKTQADDPYVIVANENTDLQMTTNKLDGSNYQLWSAEMKRALEAKNKFGFVDGTIPKPIDDYEKEGTWERCNNLVISWILCNMSPEISKFFKYKRDATTLWKLLKRRYGQTNRLVLFSLRRKLKKCSQREKSVTSYFSKLQAIWDGLEKYKEAPCGCTPCGCRMKENPERLMTFILGLNDKYLKIRRHILLMNPLPTLVDAYSMILTEEKKQRKVNAFLARTNNESKCPPNRENTYKGSKESSRDYHMEIANRCINCKKFGHTIDDCYYLNGFPVHHRLHGMFPIPKTDRRKHPGYHKMLMRSEKDATSTEKSETETEETEVSSSDEDDTSWISWFCNLNGNEFFCEVDKEYIMDDINLFGLKSQIFKYEDALDLILDIESSTGFTFSDEQNELVESAAKMLYGLIHARFILTNKGMEAMMEKFKTFDFGTCPMVYCCKQPCLPLGMSDVLTRRTVNIYCPKCEGVYHPRSKYQWNIDGAYFGTTFFLLFLITQCQGHMKQHRLFSNSRTLNNNYEEYTKVDIRKVFINSHFYKHLQAKQESSDIEEIKQRKFKAILNKLTPQNFVRLGIKVYKQANIDSALTLAGVTSQIFERALMEPVFCEMYSDFCHHLSVILPPFHMDNRIIKFKRLLINKCQEEFERKEAKEGEKKLQTLGRKFGNMQLIGELYKKDILPENIIHACIKKLIGMDQTQYENPDEENIEALCKLMDTAGVKLDHSKTQIHMDAYFDIMSKLSNNLNLSCRIRLMLKNTYDLRKNKWQRCSKVESPKKIHEIYRDAVQAQRCTNTTTDWRREVNPLSDELLFNMEFLKELVPLQVCKSNHDRSSPSNSERSIDRSSSSDQDDSSEENLIKASSDGIFFKKSVSALKEYYSARDENEVALCIEELKSPFFYPWMVSSWIANSFERKDIERDLLSKLLIYLCRDKSLISHAYLIQGFEYVLSTLEDAVIDAPKAPEFLGRMFANMVSENVISFNEVGRLVREGGEEIGCLIDSGLAAAVVGSTLQNVKIEQGDSVLKETIIGSGLKLVDFKPPQPCSTFRKLLDPFL